MTDLPEYPVSPEYPLPRDAGGWPRVEVFRGRKLTTQRGGTFGTIVQFIDGVYVGTLSGGWSPAALNRAAEALRQRVIIGAAAPATEPNQTRRPPIGDQPR